MLQHVFFVVFGIYLFILTESVQCNSPCITPDNKSGRCIGIKSCSPLLDLLKNRSRTIAETTFLQKSKCKANIGYAYPNVCCVESEAVAPTEVGKRFKIDTLPTRDQCGISTEDQILGGTVATLNEFPWMALLQFENAKGVKNYSCGGVLISRRYILTAAHCVNATNIKLINVRLGEHTINTDPDCTEYTGGGKYCADYVIDIPPEYITIHENYTKISKKTKVAFHDIALVRLARDVQFTDYIKPICLPISEEERNVTLVDQHLSVSGWGATEVESQSNQKLKLQVKVWNNEQCSSKYNQSGVTIGESQICAGGARGEDSCRGDSGSPLMALKTFDDSTNWFLYGIVSFGRVHCGMQNWPGVYTRVGAYSSWIVNNMQP